MSGWPGGFLVAAVVGVATVSAETPELPHPYTLSQQAEAAMRDGRHADALAAASQAAAQWPTGPGALVRLAESLGRAGRVPEALVWLERAAALGASPAEGAVGPWFASATGGTPEVLRAMFARNALRIGPETVAFTLAERNLLPESVARDAQGRFYVGSMHLRKIVRVDQGRESDWVKPGADSLYGVLGLKIDAPRGHLLANSCNIGNDPAMSPPDPATVGHAALHRYDLATGRLLKRYPAGSTKEPVCFNDLAITAAGDVYLTAGPGGLWRVRREADTLEHFVPPGSGFFNGLDVTPDGRTLYVADHFAGVRTLDLATMSWGAVATPPDVTLGGIDGLYVRGRTLVAVQNALAHVPARVIEVGLDATGTRALCLTVLERGSRHFADPTTGVLDGDVFHYVAGSHVDDIDDKGWPWPAEKLIPSVVLSVPLQGGCRPEHNAPGS